jgi:hypothetical protein
LGSDSRYHRFGSSDSLAGHLIRDVVDSLPGIGVPAIDLIILSGDIAERGKRAECNDALLFVDQMCQALGLGHERVVVVPGSHDVSWDLSEAYFAECRDEDADPQVPYSKKWRHYQDFVTKLHDPAAFNRGTTVPAAPGGDVPTQSRAAYVPDRLARRRMGSLLWRTSVPVARRPCGPVLVDGRALPIRSWGTRQLRCRAPVAGTTGPGESIDQFEVNLKCPVGLGGPAIARDESDPVLRCGGGDERVIDGTAGNAELRQPTVESLRAVSAEKPRQGKVVGEQSGYGGGSAAAGRREPGQH